MSNLDTRILEAIKAETDATMQDHGRELGLFGLIRESFKGTFRWAVIAAVVLQVAFAGGVVYCAIGLFGTDDPSAKLNWLAVGLTAVIAFGLLRLWFFMEINRLSLAREIKRLELQVAVVANSLRSPGDTTSRSGSS